MGKRTAKVQKATAQIDPTREPLVFTSICLNKINYNSYAF